MAARVNSESARRLSNCVTALLREQPFFGSLALRLPIRADATRETVASDGREIRYSPRWIADTDAHVIETAMARIVLACVSGGSRVRLYGALLEWSVAVG